LEVNSEERYWGLGLAEVSSEEKYWRLGLAEVREALGARSTGG
jgi:hypothetical protein